MSPRNQHHVALLYASLCCACELWTDLAMPLIVRLPSHKGGAFAHRGCPPFTYGFFVIRDVRRNDPIASIRVTGTGVMVLDRGHSIRLFIGGWHRTVCERQIFNDLFCSIAIWNPGPTSTRQRFLQTRFSAELPLDLLQRNIGFPNRQFDDKAIGIFFLLPIDVVDSACFGLRHVPQLVPIGEQNRLAGIDPVCCNVAAENEETLWTTVGKLATEVRLKNLFITKLNGAQFY